MKRAELIKGEIRDVILFGIMHRFHIEVIKAQRWDLSTDSRATLWLYLN